MCIFVLCKPRFGMFGWLELRKEFKRLKYLCDE